MNLECLECGEVSNVENWKPITNEGLSCPNCGCGSSIKKTRKPPIVKDDTVSQQIADHLERIANSLETLESWCNENWSGR